MATLVICPLVGTDRGIEPQCYSQDFDTAGKLLFPDAVKDSMAGELNKAVRLVYEKLCQIEDELASSQELVTQTGRDLGAKHCEAAQSLQGCGDSINTLISLLQKTRIE